jgi:hypothetical protein
LKTFEYDLGMEKNNLQTLYKIRFESYTNNVTGANDAESKSKKDWTKVSLEEKAEECFNFLSLIEDSKGEFAQKLAYKLATETGIDFAVPKYIEDAILWVTDIKPNTTNA